MLGALAEGTSRFSNIQIGDDSWVFVQALRELGFSIQQPDTNVYVINGSGGHIPASAASVWCGSAGTAGAQVVTAYGFERLDLVRIDALVRTGNAASVRVVENVGYQREGLLRRAVLQSGEPVDHFLYAILLED